MTEIRFRCCRFDSRLSRGPRKIRRRLWSFNVLAFGLDRPFDASRNGGSSTHRRKDHITVGDLFSRRVQRDYDASVRQDRALRRILWWVGHRRRRRRWCGCGPRSFVRRTGPLVGWCAQWYVDDAVSRVLVVFEALGRGAT